MGDVHLITVWQCFAKQPDGTGAWEHNHIADGYDPDLVEPVAKFDSQRKAWRGQVWRGTRAWIIDGKVVY